MQRNKSIFLKIAPARKAKYKNQKCEKQNGLKVNIGSEKLQQDNGILLEWVKWIAYFTSNYVVDVR